MKKGPLFDKKIDYCLGVFDLTHADLLVAGGRKDKLVKRYKGDLRPVLNQQIRPKIVDSLKPVDYVYLIDKDG